MENLIINIAEDFSQTLGGRWERIGPYSGELFYNKILKSKYEEALQKNVKLEIYLDGTRGYGSSFLDQSFGELYRNYDKNSVKNNIIFHTNYFENIVDYIKSVIWT